MRIHEILVEREIIISNAAPTVGLWFMHQSSSKLSELKPLSYAQLEKIRPNYPIEHRKQEERNYKKLINNQADTSFLYATIVGYNKFDPPTEYPGYTYYFKLNAKQIKNCVFDIIAKQKYMLPTKGYAGLYNAITIWDAKNQSFKKGYLKDVGVIQPRIEVIIPYTITPEYMIQREEDR